MNMERDDILKSIGFTDKFLSELHAFEKSVPELLLEVPFDVTEPFVKFDEISDQITVTVVNDNYNQDMIIRQG